MNYGNRYNAIHNIIVFNDITNYSINIVNNDE